MIWCRRKAATSYARDAEALLGRERRAGTVMRGADISVPYPLSYALRELRGYSQ